MAYRLASEKLHMMPTHFGPVAGPRQDGEGARFALPDERRLDMRGAIVTARGDLVEAMLPPGFALTGPPRLNITFTYMDNLRWLAGRGYNTLSVMVDTLYSGAGGPARGPLMLVLWENMGDPILTGREQLGINKIPCELPHPDGESGRCVARWEGFEFLSLELDGLAPGAPAMPAPPQPGEAPGTLHVRYVPHVAGSAVPAIAEAVLTPAGDTGTDIRSAETGTGRIAIASPGWKEMPTQFHIVRALAAAITGEVVEAYRITAIGAGDLDGQHVLGPLEGFGDA